MGKLKKVLEADILVAESKVIKKIESKEELITYKDYKTIANVLVEKTFTPNLYRIRNTDILLYNISNKTTLSTSYVLKHPVGLLVYPSDFRKTGFYYEVIDHYDSIISPKEISEMISSSKIIFDEYYNEKQVKDEQKIMIRKRA